MRQLNPLHKFRQEVRELMKKPSFLRSINKKCSQWDNLCEPNEVISEAYLIGQQLLLKGGLNYVPLTCFVLREVNSLSGMLLLRDCWGKIPNTEAWMRSTIWNLIRNSSKKQLREQKKLVSLNASLSSNDDDSRTLEDTLASQENPCNLYVQAEIQEEQKQLRQRQQQHSLLSQALATLNTEEQAIIRLKWMKGLSWQEVASLLNSDLKLATLRKKGQRAKDKLLKTYHVLIAQN